jgi:hypothetical protein
MRYLLFPVVLLEPFIEALCDHNAPFLLLHTCPHATIVVQRVVAAVDSLQHGAVVRVALGPEGNKTYDIERCQRIAPRASALQPTHPISWPGAGTWCCLRALPPGRKRCPRACLALHHVDHLTRSARGRDHGLGRPIHDSQARNCSSGGRRRRREHRLRASATAPVAAAPRKAATCRLGCVLGTCRERSPRPTHTDRTW